MNFPLVSVLIPIHNEASLVQHSFPHLIEILNSFGFNFELILSENGSTDGTLAFAKELQQTNPQVKVEHLPIGDYGLALKHGLKQRQGDAVFIFNADFWDKNFIRDALVLLKNHDLVLGSKIMKGARGQRPLFRRWITRSFNAFLRVLYGFQGTDTHGMKAFKRHLLVPIASRCITNHFIFDTELVLRAQREGLKTAEIPVDVKELRQPSYGSLIARGPKVMWYLINLWIALNLSPPWLKPAKFVRA